MINNELLQKPMTATVDKDSDIVLTEMIKNLIDVKIIFYNWLNNSKERCVEQ